MVEKQLQMEFLSLLFIAIGLSFDSFAVSVSCGLMSRTLELNRIFRLVSVFAMVQGLCFFAGCLLGKSLHGLINNFDHWIAFVLLFVMGCKMIYGSITAKEDEDCPRCNPLKLSSVFVMAIATSIDAIIVGIGIAIINISVNQLLSAIIIIAVVTGLAALMGVFIGKKTGKHIGGKAEILGGLVLIAIGTKILIEHLVN